MNIAAGPVLAAIPSPPRGVWELDLGFVSVPIRAYALCIIAGIVIAIWWGERRWIARGGQSGAIVDIAVFAVPFGLIGGRLYHVITDYHRYFGEGQNPVDALKIWDGGLGIWGAIALGAVGAWIACKRQGIPLPPVADALAPGIVMAQAVGRLGNYFNQELYGDSTDVPWALEIYQRINPATGIPDPLAGVSNGVVERIVHPTFLYELLWNVGVALLVVWADRHFRLGHGRAFALYVAGYTAGRFWIEMMRSDEATMVFGVRINVWVAALVFLGAIAYIVVARKRGERESAELLRGTDDEPDTVTAAGETESETEAGAETSTAEEAGPAEPTGESEHVGQTEQTEQSEQSNSER